MRGKNETPPTSILVTALPTTQDDHALTLPMALTSANS
jgi:hypothetical protein